MKRRRSQIESALLLPTLFEHMVCERYDVLICSQHTIEIKPRLFAFFILPLPVAAASSCNVRRCLSFACCVLISTEMTAMQPKPALYQMFFYQLNHACQTNNTCRVIDNRNTFSSDFEPTISISANGSDTIPLTNPSKVVKKQQAGRQIRILFRY